MKHSPIENTQSLIGNFYRCVQTSRGHFLVIDTAIDEEYVMNLEYIKCTAAQTQRLQVVKAGKRITVKVHTEPADQTWPVDQLLIADSIQV